MINYAETEKFHAILYAQPGVFAFYGIIIWVLRGGDWSGLIG